MPLPGVAGVFGSGLYGSLRVGLVAEYLFAFDASDTSGNSNDGTLNGDASVSGGVLTLDGTGDYVDAGSAASLDNMSQLSISFWGFWGTMPTALARIVTKASGNTTGWTLWSGKITGTYENALEFNVQDGGGGIGSWYADNVITATKWYHVSITWDGTGGAGAVKIYVDGNAKTVVRRNSAYSSHDDSANNVLIGIRSSFWDNAFDGQLDDVRIYSRVLSASEITALYNLRPDLH